MTEIEIGQRRLKAQITGKLRDGDWDYRESKSITLEADYETVLSLFQNGAAWAFSCPASRWRIPTPARW